MSKNREAKRKAKKKAAKLMPAKLEQARAEHVAEAIMDICRPWEILFRKEPDRLKAFHILWFLGVIAWNSAVHGALEPEDDFEEDPLTRDEKDFYSVVANTLIVRKYRLYPNLSAEVCNFSVPMVSGKPRLKVELGFAIPLEKIPISPEKLNCRSTPKELVEAEIRHGGSPATLARFIDKPEEAILAWKEGKIQLDKDEEELLHMAFETPAILGIDENADAP